MYIKMLEAISEMVDIKGDTEVKEALVRVRCGKSMLDKIIEGMKGDVDEMVKVPLVNEKEAIDKSSPVETQKPIDRKKKMSKDDVEITVDNGKIKAIKNAKDNTMIELDGIPMHWKQALGKSFTKGKVL